MQRDFIKDLQKWRQQDERVPLLIRGARQVGKSWGIREFGQQFPHFVEINFEKQPSFKQAFQGDVDVPKLLQQLSLYTGKPLEAGNSLLFLDEIQECPAALNYLRYFKEECPKLHLVAAGSLLDFMLDDLGMPVGRVDYLYVKPLSFAEFLHASGRQDLRQAALNEHNDPLLHQQLLDQLHTYFWLGGMPAVVNAWLQHQDPQACQRIQDRIISTYQDDFNKYSSTQQFSHVEKTFNNLPVQFGKKFVYTRLDADVRANTLKSAIQLLNKAGIAHYCYFTSSYQPPLSAGINEKFFKLFFLDIGLAQRLLGLSQQDWLLKPLSIDNLGALTEQFVAQELLAYQPNHQAGKIFYWQRESKNAQAEIDFIISQQQTIIPIEVKSGKTGRLKSLQYYLEQHPHCPYGLKISEQGFTKHGQIQQIALYAIEQWLRIA